MTGSIPPPNPLTYEGQVVVPFIQRPFPPETTFNKFPVPTIWIDPLAKNAYIQVAKPLGVADWVLIGGSPGSLQTITTPDSVVVVPSAGNINFLNGTGMNITGSGNNITFNSIGGAFTWNSVASTFQIISIGNGYVPTNGAQTVFLLPIVAPFGSVFKIAGFGSGGWKINQNGGQSLIVGTATTTIGVAGSVESLFEQDSIEVLCIVTDLVFKAINWQGNLTVT